MRRTVSSQICFIRHSLLTSSVDTVRALLLGTITNGGPETNDRRLVLRLAGLGKGIVDGGEVATYPGSASLNSLQQDIQTCHRCQRGAPAIHRTQSAVVRSR